MDHIDLINLFLNPHAGSVGFEVFESVWIFKLKIMSRREYVPMAYYRWIWIEAFYEDTIFLVSTMSIINWIPFDLSTQIPFRNECSVELQYHMKERDIYKSYDL